MDEFVIDTPIGQLAAHFAGDRGYYEGIEVELRKPDGSSGTVCLVEVETLEPGTDREGYELHTIAWDGCDQEPAGKVVCDYDGIEMSY